MHVPAIKFQERVLRNEVLSNSAHLNATSELCRQVPHAKNSKITLYIDHGEWERTTVTSRKREFKDSMSKKVGDQEEPSLPMHCVMPIVIVSTT